VRLLKDRARSIVKSPGVPGVSGTRLENLEKQAPIAQIALPGVVVPALATRYLIRTMFSLN